MPNIAKEAIHRQSDSIVLGDSFIIKGILQFRQRFDLLLGSELLHKAYSQNKYITSDKFNDNGKKEINSTGQQLGQQHSLQPSQQQGKHHSQQHCLQHETQHRQHQDRHFESQHAKHQERQLGCNFIYEIIYLPLE